jgi:phenylpropionate dioxygenase-like ring-hydroxylating dioxygenase large terminal subunit
VQQEDLRAQPALTNDSPMVGRMWHAVAASEEIGIDPAQVWVGGEPWLLSRLGGELVAFYDQCPHRLAPMTSGRIVTAEDGTPRLQCGYHGWRYDVTGQCDLIPALGKSEKISKRARLRAPAGLTEAYGLIWLAPLEPLTPIPEFPEWADPAFTTARSEIIRTRASAGQLVDNFLDAAHFPYVHAGSFGTDEAQLAGGEVVRTGNQVVATFGTPYREGGIVRDHTVTKTVGASLSVHLRLELDDGATMGILLACLPETATTTRVFKLLARDDIATPADLQEFVKSEDQILAEDLLILERYPDSSLALDPRAELHTRSDRLSLAWRTLLADASREVHPA